MVKSTRSLRAADDWYGRLFISPIQRISLLLLLIPFLFIFYYYYFNLWLFGYAYSLNSAAKLRHFEINDLMFGFGLVELMFCFFSMYSCSSLIAEGAIARQLS